MIKLTNEALCIVANVLSEYEEAYGAVNIPYPAPSIDYAWSYEYEVYELVNWMIKVGIVDWSRRELEEYRGIPWVWRLDEG